MDQQSNTLSTRPTCSCALFNNICHMYKSYKYKTYTLIFYKLIFVCSTSKNNYNVMIDTHSIVQNVIFLFIGKFSKYILGSFVNAAFLLQASIPSHNFVVTTGKIVIKTQFLNLQNSVLKSVTRTLNLLAGRRRDVHCAIMPQL